MSTNSKFKETEPIIIQSQLNKQPSIPEQTFSSENLDDKNNSNFNPQKNQTNQQLEDIISEINS